MYWLLSEYVLKGIYLGLVLFVAVRADWPATGKVALCSLGGLVLCLLIAAWGKLREGYKVKRRLPAFLLFLLLESPRLVYAGVILGMAVGTYLIRPQGPESELPIAIGAGAAAGIVFWLLRHVSNRWFRLGTVLVLAAAAVGGAVYWFEQSAPGFLSDPTRRMTFGANLLLGIPIFYLLTFAGLAEESEVETGAMCAALGVGLWALTADLLRTQWLIFLVPLTLYYFYTMRVLPGLRVFKHVVRGIGFVNAGRYRPALVAFGRALRLDPKNALARESMWRMHRALDLSQLKQDREMLALVDHDLCLDRAKSLLLEAGPSAEQLAEADHLLDLVVAQQPAKAALIHYWRAVARTHARLYDQAAAELESVLDASKTSPKEPEREAVLLPAWQLALTLHPELNRRVGTPQLAVPGRRMEAIAAVERQLAASPQDAVAWELKRVLYSGLDEAEYETAAEAGAAADFDHGYAQQLGLALANDPARWQRGVEYLRLAARGLPAQGPTIYNQIAQAYQGAGDADGVWHYYELAQRAGRAAGPKNLTDADRQTYFAIVKLLAEEARSQNDVEKALENYQLYAESERSGLETLRILADLYERKGDVVNALRATEKGLVYNAKDKDLLERKDRYYYSLPPKEVPALPEAIRSSLDVDYCQRKARSLLDLKEADVELIDWAQHLAELALAARPNSVAAKVLLARALRRRGEIEPSRTLLEDAYTNKPEKFASDGDEEAWFLSCKLLGDVYLNELGKPDLAVSCFHEFRKSPRSGADTMYKLGRAYESIGDLAKAARCYETVTTFEQHPLYYEARDGLERVKRSGNPVG